MRGVGEGPGLAETKKASCSFAQARFPSLCNKITAEGEPPFTHGLLEFLQSANPTLSLVYKGPGEDREKHASFLLCVCLMVCVPCSIC